MNPDAPVLRENLERSVDQQKNLLNKYLSVLKDILTDFQQARFNTYIDS
ncbi:MAG: hypothetical protein GX846_02590 [Deltaproteobacteria bacterium]|nr:hypothetical protein [Deltaproteobacteria bacterium]